MVTSASVAQLYGQRAEPVADRRYSQKGHQLTALLSILAC